MMNHATSAVFQPRRIQTRPSAMATPAAAVMTEELLPFTVRLVRNEEDMGKAVQIRHSAYARHLPDFAQTLQAAERADAEDGVVVLLAESKLDGSPLGTMRIQTNEFKPLCLEQSVTLPDWLVSQPLAEATRLGVTNDRGGRLVTTVLFKAYYQYCQQIGVEWMVIAGRAPVDRMYDRLLFGDVFPGMGYIPLVHAGNLPHRIMSFNIETARQRWTEANHPLLAFMCSIHHPDIKIGDQSGPVFPSMSMPTSPTHGAAFPM